MTSRRIDDDLRNLILSQPGAFEGDTPDECFGAVAAAAGISNASLSEVKAALNRLGYTLRQKSKYRDGHLCYGWQIPLPTAQPAAPVNRRRF